MAHSIINTSLRYQKGTEDASYFIQKYTQIIIHQNTNQNSEKSLYNVYLEDIPVIINKVPLHCDILHILYLLKPAIHLS